jgi:hypothetical protein
MEEFHLITQLKDNPGALIILCVLVVYKTIDLLIRLVLPHVLPYFRKKRAEDFVSKLEKVEEFIENDAVERKKRQEEVDRRLDAQYEYIKEAVLQSGIAVIWSASNVPMVELFRAALLNIKLGANGNLREKLVGSIMSNPNGKTVWKSVLNAYRKEHGGVMNQHFNETIEWIEKRIA